MGNPKVAMKAELEAKFKRKYDEKQKEMEAEFRVKMAVAEADFHAMLKMAIQQCSDAALMALDDVMDVTPEIAQWFHKKHCEYTNEISNMVVHEDDDPEMVWTKATIDRRLKQIVGEENFANWDERYGKDM